MRLFSLQRVLGRYAIVCVALALLATGCAASSAASSTKGDSTAKNGHHAAINETVQIGSAWQMQLTAVKTSQGMGTEIPNGGDVYLLFDLHVVNKASQSQDLYTVTTFTLRDAASHLYTPLPLSFVTTPDGTVASGASVSGEIAFEVPVSQSQFTLAYTAAEGQGYWAITQSTAQ